MNPYTDVVENKLHSVVGALSNMKTNSARRRVTPDKDEYPGVDPFIIDQSKIGVSKVVRRLSTRTQVFSDLLNQHIRTRSSHSGEVTLEAVTIAGILGLNIELTRAIGMAHDVGHTPFGHEGEQFIAHKSRKPFTHETFGIVILQHVERNGTGLNLTHEVLSGILRNLVDTKLSEEAKVVMWSDRFAYVTADYNDIQRVGFEFPKNLVMAMQRLGDNQRQRMRTLTASLCLESAEVGSISFCHSETAELFDEIKQGMYKVYRRVNATNVEDILSPVLAFIKRMFPDSDPYPILALMTDNDVLYLASQGVLDYARFQHTTVAELAPFLSTKKIVWWEPDLSW